MHLHWWLKPPLLESRCVAMLLRQGWCSAYCAKPQRLWLCCHTSTLLLSTTELKWLVAVGSASVTGRHIRLPPALKFEVRH